MNKAEVNNLTTPEGGICPSVHPEEQRGQLPPETTVSSLQSRDCEGRPFVLTISLENKEHVSYFLNVTEVLHAWKLRSIVQHTFEQSVLIKVFSIQLAGEDISFFVVVHSSKG